MLRNLLTLFAVSLIGLLLSPAVQSMDDWTGMSNGEVCSPTVLDFEDVTPNTSFALTDYGGLEWDREGPQTGWGWSVWSTSNTLPYTGTNWLVNTHGKNFVGYTFPGTVYFNGAFFTKSSRTNTVDIDDPGSNTAEMIRLYFYDSNLVEISVSDWFALDRYPTWFAAEIDVHRIVIEHDTLNVFDNSGKGVPDAEWYSTDYIVFNEEPGFVPPDYCSFHDCDPDTLHVPSDEPTIQAGIDAVAPGGLVLVADGVYSGPGNFDLDFQGKVVTLRSENGPEHCVIDCQGSPDHPRRAINFTHGEGPNTIIEGFSITKGFSNINDHFDDHLGGAVYCRMASPTFRNCDFHDNRGHHGGVFYITEDASPLIENCHFSQNVAGDVGGVAMIRMGCSPLLRNCDFVNNSARHGGALNIYNSAPTVDDCLIANNHATGTGGGLFLQDNASPSIINCTVFGNSATMGGGVWAEQRGGRSGMTAPVFTNCIISHSGSGGALENMNAQPSFACCNIFGNVGGDWTGYIAPQLGTDGNLSADPQFCALFAGDYTLHENSPCAPENSICGVLIGSEEVGCSGAGPDLINLVQWPLDEGGNGHWYAVLPEAMFWEEATGRVNSIEHDGVRGYLATITSQAENDFIFDHITSGVHTPTILNQFWLGGLKSEGLWTWITDEPFDYTNWSPGEPNNASAETALGMWGHFTSHPLRVPGKWNNNLPNDNIHSLHRYWTVIEWGTPGPGGVIATDEWINLYCQNPTLDGIPLGSRTIIEAYDPDGVLCGVITVNIDASFGFLMIYRDDPYTRCDEGAEPGDIIRLSINGQPVATSTPVIWEHNGDVVEVCDFTSHQCTEIALHEGWNLVSWNSTYSAPTEEVIAGIESDVDIILGFDGSGLTYDPELPQFSNLRHMDYHSGYWFRMHHSATLTICGLPIPEGEAIGIQQGWNLVSYWPREITRTEFGFSSILEHLILAYGFDEGIHVWTPGAGWFNSLQELVPGFGYWIKSSVPSTLVYPGFFGDSTSRGQITLAASYETGPTVSRRWMSLFGQRITLDGRELMSGSVIEALTLNGEVCGRGVYSEGTLQFMPLYGNDLYDPETEVLPVEGEALGLRINGQDLAEEIVWISHGARVQLAILSSANATSSDLPQRYELAQNYPNPFNPTTEISFDLAEASGVKLEVYNIMGQKVATLVDDYLEAGSHTAVWDASMSASGVYLYRLEAGLFMETRKMVLLK